jgi:glutamyl-tRNA reductase
MQHIGIVGINWRSDGPESIERFQLSREGRDKRLRALATDLEVCELVVLSTCNRVEVIFVSDPPRPVTEMRKRVFQALSGREPAPGEAHRSLRAWEGEGAVEHVFLVASGLDSSKVGETEVTGQVREALELSRQEGLVGARLELLFRQALKLAGATRAATGLGDGRTSLAEIALEFVGARLALEAGPVALVGVSPMTERCARSLSAGGTQLFVVNRTVARAEKLCRDLQGDAQAWSLEEFQASPPAVAAVISATGAEGLVLRAEHLGALSAAATGEPPVLVDMALPSDIAPDAARALGLMRLDMDGILARAEKTRANHLMEAGAARELVDAAVTRFAERLAERSVDCAIGKLHESYNKIAEAQLERLLRVKLNSLDADEEQVLRRFVERLTAYFAHLPASGLREIARTQGPEAVRQFFAHAEANLEQDLDLVFEGGAAFASLSAEDPDDAPQSVQEGVGP